MTGNGYRPGEDRWGGDATEAASIIPATLSVKTKDCGTFADAVHYPAHPTGPIVE